MRWSVRAEACSYLLTPLFCDNFHGIISYTETLYTFHLVPFTVSPDRYEGRFQGRAQAVVVPLPVCTWMENRATKI